MTISRRGFLKLAAGAGAAGAAATLGLPTEAQAAHEFPGHPDRRGVLCDTSLCIGCRSCEVACNEANGLPKPAEGQPALDDPKVLAEKRRMDHAHFTVVNKYGKDETGGPEVFVKTQCMHCDEPACFAACLAKAFTKTPEGAVVYNSAQCIGCRYCMQACPFYVPTYEYHKAFTPRVRKCTMCFDRVSDGKIPACVQACPQEALIFGKRSDLLKIARRRLDADKSGYVDHIYGEREVGGTCWMYVSKAPFEKLGFKTDVGTEALPKLTYGYLATIPVLHTGLPILLAGFYLLSRGVGKGHKDQEGRK
jgi:Fe-S-cluster-containing dehydrogenase component